jgi:hypothetical protein
VRHTCFLLPLLLPAIIGLSNHSAMAQQVTVATPYHSLSDSFFERTGVSWGGRIGGVDFSVGGGTNVAMPQFGGFQPNAGLNMGFGGTRGFMNLGMSQGSRRSFVSQTPSVTMMNGMSASIHDTSNTPFVVGHVPVVGGFPGIGYFNPIRPLPYYSNSSRPISDSRIQAVKEAMAQGSRSANRTDRAAPEAATPRAVAPEVPAEPSSATRAAPSVGEARRLHEQEQTINDNEAMVWFERGKTAEEGGKLKAAKLFYRMADRRATGKLHKTIQARLAALGE